MRIHAINIIKTMIIIYPILISFLSSSSFFASEDGEGSTGIGLGLGFFGVTSVKY